MRDFRKEETFLLRIVLLCLLISLLALLVK